MNQSIKQFSFEELEELMKREGFPLFRAKQIYQWLYQHHALQWDDMTNVPKTLRAFLSENYSIGASQITDKQQSTDGTRKYLITYEDGVCVETVGIPSRDGSRLTVCFSTQAGCPMACSFCATGREGLTRNLLAGEMVDQILHVQDDFQKRVTNVVGMGQGEPFLNYENVLKALRIINDKRGVEIGARHISISTCGIIPGIQHFSEEPEQFTLAISLHSADQTTRQLLMPKTEKYPLEQLREALVEYVIKTGRRVTLEYIMIKEITDTPQQLVELCKFCNGLLCHVNLIPINAIPSSPYKPSKTTTIHQWLEEVKKSGTEITLRQSRGSDINGACGQLKNTLQTK